MLCLQTCITSSLPRLCATSWTSHGRLGYEKGSCWEGCLKWCVGNTCTSQHILHNLHTLTHFLTVCLPQLFFMQLLVGLIQQVCVYSDFDKHRNAFRLTHSWKYEKGGMSFIVKVAFSPIKMKHFSLVSCSGWFPPYRTQWNHSRYEQTQNTIYCHKIRAFKKSVVLSVTGNELF